MYDDNNWQPVQGEQLKPFLARINPVSPTLQVGEATAQVSWRVLPFYEGIALIRVQDTAWQPGSPTLWYLAKAGDMYRLDGSSNPIHEVNEIAPIKITDANAVDYLKFFCFFVRGEEGPFMIAESMGDPDMPTDMDPQIARVVEGSLHPVSLEGQDPEGNFEASAVVYYGNAMFSARFRIYTDGMVEMLDDDPIATNLPVINHAPIN